MTQRDPHRLQRGISLIEALVAMLVLALGVLGMAGIQARTMTSTRVTHLRAEAVRAAEDLLDRIQANTEIKHVRPNDNPYVTALGEPPEPERDCAQAPCNGAQLAAFDLSQWKAQLARTLPSGDAMVFASDTDANQLGILISWTEASAKNETVANEADAALYSQAVGVRDATGQAGTGLATAACPEGQTCHLVFIRP